MQSIAIHDFISCFGFLWNPEIVYPHMIYFIRIAFFHRNVHGITHSKKQYVQQEFSNRNFASQLKTF